MLRWKNLIILIILVIILGAGTVWFFYSWSGEEPSQTSAHLEFYNENDKFRNKAARFIEKTAKNYFTESTTSYPEELSVEGNWSPMVTIYLNGDIVEKGKGENKNFARALKGAVYNALDEDDSNELGLEKIKEARFLVKANYKGREINFVTYEGKGFELVNGTVASRRITRPLLKKKVEEVKEFLLRMENSKTNGFYKKYGARKDKFPDRVHTVYSASVVYTLMKIYDYKEDPRIKNGLDRWGQFLLSMQKKEGENKGAFSYSYYLKSEKRQKKYVVGTTALTIFTLLDMYERTGEDKYIKSARLGGDWLLTMQEDNGTMQSYKRFRDGSWYNSTQFSTLYNGQVLSALSKLYEATGEQKYFNAASKIAEHFLEKVKSEGCYVGDDYRDPNPISSAWIVMSLLDFHQAKNNPFYRTVVMECSSQLLDRQKGQEEGLGYYGRWERAYSTSGNGWLAEVMSEVYMFCKKQEKKNCKKYKNHLIKAFRWLIQNTYTSANSYMLVGPERARGGMYWDTDNRYIRTDSNCHGGNPYVNLLPYLDNKVLLSVPEKKFEFLE